MKAFTSFIASLALTAVASPVQGSYFVVDGLEYTVSDSEAGTVELTKWLHVGNSGADSDNGLVVVVPATVEDGGKSFTVTTVAESVFTNDENLTEVVLPNTINGDGLGGHNFVGCDRLESVTLPEGLSKLKMYSFMNLPNLRQLTLPEGLESMVCSIYNCGLESLRIPVGVGTFGMSVWNCKSLRSLEIGTISRGSMLGTQKVVRELRFAENAILFEDAFPTYENLQRVIFSKGCLSCGNTLRGSMNLREVVCEGESILMGPCPLEWAAASLGKALTVWVPEGSGERFAAADVWKKFTIKEGTPDASLPDAAGVENISVDASEGAEVWTLDGVYRGSFTSAAEARSALSSGAYIIKENGKSRVVMF